MDHDSAHMVAASKVPMLKPENGNVTPITKVVKSVETTIAPITVEEKAQRRPKEVVNAARPKAVVNAAKGNNVNAVKASIQVSDGLGPQKKLVFLTNVQGNPQMDLHDKGVIDSGCSRHMTRNMSYLTDYKEIDGGYVTFGENPKGEKITRKGTKACDDAGKARMEIVHGKDYIVLPLWTADPPFSQSSKSSPDAGFKPSGDDEKKVTEEPRKEDGVPSKEGESNDQEEDDNVNSTNTVNSASTNEVNAVGAKTSIELPDDLNMPELEDIVYSGDDEDVGAEADMNNLDAFMPVSPILTTRVHKDHPVEQIIGDLNSAPQTRRMIKNLGEHGRTQKGNSCFEGSKLDRGYAGRASTI
ncbi:hypothetical protein Tco_1249954 [Tanacetum coccineum]